MKTVLADVAPEPQFVAGTAIVVALSCVAFAAALTVLIVWLVRRTKRNRS